MSDLLNALGYVGDSLDKPGRAVRGLLSGKTDELAALIPFSDSLGITDESRRTSGSELLQNLGVDVGSGLGGTLAGIGTEIATDPLTFGGGLLGRALGKGAEAAAAARGPRYSTTADDLLKMLPSNEHSHAAHVLAATASDDVGRAAMSRAASEIPPGSSMLGYGDEGVAFRTPNNRVIRMSGQEAGLEGRPISDTVLQADRAIDIPSGTTKGLNDAGDFYKAGDQPRAIRVENLPMADNVGDLKYWTKRNPETMMSPMDGLRHGAKKDGLAFNDTHLGNVGTVKGKDLIIDPGAFWTGEATKFNNVAHAKEPSPLMRAILSGTGGDNAMRAALDSGKSHPELANLLMQLGVGTGATIGATSRL